MLQSNALSDKCGHKATYEKSKVCGAASQEGTRRGGEGSGYLCLAASTLQKAKSGQPSLCWVQQQPHHLQQQLQLLRVATISRSMLHNAKNWSRDQRAGAELRTAVGLQPGPGPPQLHSSRPSCNRFPVPQPPPPCHSCLHGNHSPYTTYTIKHTHHMHTVWNTHTLAQSQHPQLGSRICQRIFQASNQNCFL